MPGEARVPKHNCMPGEKLVQVDDPLDIAIHKCDICSAFWVVVRSNNQKLTARYIERSSLWGVILCDLWCSKMYIEKVNKKLGR